MKAEQTLGKLWEEFVHQDEGQTSGQMGPLQLCSVEKPGMQLNNASAQAKVHTVSSVYVFVGSNKLTAL